MSNIILVLLVIAAGTWFSALIGAAVVAFVKKENGSLTDLILGLAAGVILIVSFTELLHPAIHIADASSALPVWVVVPGAFALGFMATLLLDMYIDHLKKGREKAGKTSLYKQGLMLFGALSVHNIPEGLALGVLFGALGGHFIRVQLWAVVPLVLAVALHKLPEGAAISVAFQKEGMPKLKSFLIGQLSGFFGFIAGIVGFIIAVNIDALLPYTMAFAGGAMVWVAVHELIPESKRHNQKRRYLSTVGVFIGVLMMLFVDTTLHDHGHGHNCGQHCQHCDPQQGQPPFIHPDLSVEYIPIFSRTDISFLSATNLAAVLPFSKISSNSLLFL